MAEKKNSFHSSLGIEVNYLFKETPNTSLWISSLWCCPFFWEISTLFSCLAPGVHHQKQRGGFGDLLANFFKSLFLKPPKSSYPLPLVLSVSSSILLRINLLFLVADTYMWLVSFLRAEMFWFDGYNFSSDSPVLSSILDICLHQLIKYYSQLNW